MVVALIVFVSAIAQIILSDAVCRRIIDRVAPEFIDGHLELSHASVNMFTRFPKMTATLDNVVLTYPADRFAAGKSMGGGNVMLSRFGSGDQVDTLASFRHLTASVNPFSLLSGTLRLNDLSLDHPRAFIHKYPDGTSNLEVLKVSLAGEEDDEDENRSQDSGNIRLDIKKIHLGDRPLIVYTDQVDTLMALMTLRNMNFDGRLYTADFHESTFKAGIDSLFVTGRMGLDTLLFSLDHFRADCVQGVTTIESEATAFAATRSFGRVRIPLGLEGTLAARHDEDGRLMVNASGLDLDVASLCIKGDVDLCVADTLGVKAVFSVPGTGLQDIIDNFGVRSIPELKKVNTDAVLSADVRVDGYYDSVKGSLPAFEADVSIPHSYVRYGGNLVVPKLDLSASVSGKQSDNDPFVALKAAMDISLDKLGEFVGDMLGMEIGGQMQASADGSFHISQLNMYRFSQADLHARFDAHNVRAHNDTLDVFVDSLQVRTGLMENRFAPKSAKAPKSLGMFAKVDSLSVRYGDMAGINGRDISAFFQGATSLVAVSDSVKYNPLRVKLKMGRVRVEGMDSLRLSLRNSVNTLSVRPSSGNDRMPMVNIASENERLRLAKGANRVVLSGFNVDADAKMKGEDNSTRRGGKRLGGMRQRQEDEFRSFDISFDLGEEMLRYYDMWNMSGNLALKSARLMTPLFPIRTMVTDFHGSFDNDHVALDTLRVVSGASNFAASGSVSNLRRAIRKYGKVKLDLGVNTDSLAVSELLAAYGVGKQNMQRGLDRLSEASDSELEKLTSETSDELENSASSSLLVLPANLDADIRLRGKGVSYSTLSMSDVNADLKIKQRCLLLSDMRAISNAGSVYADAFYSTKSKDDLYAGVDFTFDDISAGQVLSLMPQLEEVMPLIKSFDGLLSCNVAVMSQLDTCMNLVSSSANGVVRITGSDLHFNDNKQIAKIAKMLWVKNPKRVAIDTMTVEGVLKDNVMEIFPFVMKIDKWAVAAAGIQNLDKSFNYHVSVTKSPIGIRLGANITGENFDKFNFKLGKAKYRDLNVPSFSKVIDTTRVNLRQSIVHIFDRGVERAVRESRSQAQLARARERMGYVQSVALDSLEAVSEADKKRMESMDQEASVNSESVVVPVDSTAVSAALDSLNLSTSPESKTSDAKSKKKQSKDKRAKASGDVTVSDKRRDGAAAVYHACQFFALPPRRMV